MHGDILDAFGNPMTEKDMYTPNKRNMIHCTRCGKEKLQFETKAKANRYIERNAHRIEAINGKSPKRSYFCSNCGCWHVTSTERYTSSGRI